MKTRAVLSAVRSSCYSPLTIAGRAIPSLFRHFGSSSQVWRSSTTASASSAQEEFHDPSTERKLTTLELQYKVRKGEKLSMITAYDFPTSRHAENVGFDIVLVGDSLGMVVLGYNTTQPVTMEEMLHHLKAVRRGAPSRFIVADLPFGSYELGIEQAFQNSLRLIKEGGADAIKLEGGKNRAETVERLVDAGIAIMGHVGLTPQGIGVLGGFRAQGRTAVKARAVLDDALALEKAGAFSVIVECVPSQVAEALSSSLEIPVIGIGAGPKTDGQVLVYHDLLGIQAHPHYEKHVPRFCKTYAQLGHETYTALKAYHDETKAGEFPTEEYSPYKMSEKEADKFAKLLAGDETIRRAEGEKTREKLMEADEYGHLKLY